MRDLREFESSRLHTIDFVLSDLDDTLTHRGVLPSQSYAGLEKLQQSGKKVVVVTGRPAGWCDMIARFWPVDGVVGENGAFYFRYRREQSLMVREFLYSEVERARDQARLAEWFARLREKWPALRLASDQAFRISDIAIDICEDVAPLDKETVASVVAELEGLGATVKVSSIHINAWIGAFDKVSMIRNFLQREFGLDDAAAKERALYIGDSPNDEPMFRYFEHTVGVRNIEFFVDQMEALPQFITRAPGGLGFLEVAKLLTAERAGIVSPSRERSRRSSLPARR